MSDTGEAERPSPAPSPQPKDDRGHWAVEPRTGADGVPDIFFKVIKPGSPAEQQTLKSDVERTLSLVNSIYGKPTELPKRDEAIAKLIKLAQVGLVGVRPGTAEATAALVILKGDIVNREGGRVKNDYMLKLGKWATSFAMVTSLSFLLCDLWPSLPARQVYAYRNIFLMQAGCMAGAWASFASRKVSLSFEDLAALEDDQVEPPLRLIFAAVLTTILSLVFVTGFAKVVVGGFDASRLLSSGAVAVLVGALAGLAEKALPAAVMQRASTFIAVREDKPAGNIQA